MGEALGAVEARPREGEPVIGARRGEEERKRLRLHVVEFDHHCVTPAFLLVAGQPHGVVSAAGGGGELEVLRRFGERGFERLGLAVVGKAGETAFRAR